MAKININIINNCYLSSISVQNRPKKLAKGVFLTKNKIH